jgi:hypothetical protein
VIFPYENEKTVRRGDGRIFLGDNKGGAETWVLSEVDELRLRVFERKILRRIYGPICEEATWRSSYNEELYRLYDETDLVTAVMISRLRLAGHIARMQDNLPCKKVTLDKPEGRRLVGRPNLRWTDGVMKDAKRLEVRDWRTRLGTEMDGGVFLSRPRPCMGCSARE